MIFAAFAVGVLVGWAVAVFFVTASLRNDLAQLDRERSDLQDERDALNVAWLAAEPPADVVFALQERRRLTREVM
jgi:hypothetical protein